jgi:Spherulation-specific family 4
MVTMNIKNTRVLSMIAVLVIISIALVSYGSITFFGGRATSSTPSGSNSITNQSMVSTDTLLSTGSTVSTSTSSHPVSGRTTSTMTTTATTDTTTQTATSTKVTRTTTLSQGPRPMGIVVPMYMDPNANWTLLEEAKQAYPSVPVLAIINPSNGSGTSFNSSYATGIKQMQASGIVVLGYVDTVYASVSAASAESQIDDYHLWYNVDGIFLDDMVSSPGNQSYYSTLSQYTYSLGMNYTMGNPGTNVSSSYIGTVNNLMIYESNGQPSPATIAQYSFDGPATGYSMIETQVLLPSQSYIASIAPFVSYIWATNDSPNYQ